MNDEYWSLVHKEEYEKTYTYEHSLPDGGVVIMVKAVRTGGTAVTLVHVPPCKQPTKPYR